MSEPLQDRLRGALEALARQRRTATYQELVALAEVPAPHAIHSLTLALEDLVRQDHAAGRPLLAALAVSRTAPHPGRGFFDLLAELDRYQGPARGPEAEAWHSKEIAAVFAHWC